MYHIPDEIERLFKKVNRGVPLTSNEQEYLINTEEVLAISLNQISFINTILKDHEINS